MTIEQLKAENARLKAEVERLKAESQNNCDIKEHWRAGCLDARKGESEYKAQVDRLTKERDKALTDFWYIHEGYFRLQAEVNRLTAFTTRTIIPNEDLQAQVERLTKAGDELEKRYFEYATPDDAVKAWNAAKEGKPRA